MMSGSSTPFCRARARTRIHPEAKHVTGSAKRRDQRSWIDEGGQITMAPPSARVGRGHLRVSPRRSLALVESGQALHRAVQVDRRIVALLPEEGHEPLRLAEGIGSDDMRAPGTGRRTAGAFAPRRGCPGGERRATRRWLR